MILSTSQNQSPKNDNIISVYFFQRKFHVFSPQASSFFSLFRYIPQSRYFKSICMERVKTEVNWEYLASVLTIQRLQFPVLIT